MQLETQRLILRNYVPEDFEDFWEYVSQKEVGPMCGWPAYTDKQKARERLEEVDCKHPYQSAIVWKETGKVIGSVELMDYKSERFSTVKVKSGAKEIGYLLHKDFWGKGIMPEAVRAVVQFAFENLKLPEIVICHSEANVQSGRVMDKLGFKVCGRIENFDNWMGKGPSALVQRKMTKEEYYQGKDVKMLTEVKKRRKKQ